MPEKSKRGAGAGRMSSGWPGGCHGCQVQSVSKVLIKGRKKIIVAKVNKTIFFVVENLRIFADHQKEIV